jgi:hypothetical protein
MTENSPLPPRSRWLEALHLAALCALAIGQPVFDRLYHNPGYLIQEGLTAGDVAIVAALWLTVPPLVLILIVWLLRLWKAPIGDHAQTLFVGILLAVAMITTLDRPLSPLRRYGVPGGWLATALGVAAAVWMARNYRRQGWVSSLVTYSSIGLVVFPWNFFTSKHIAAVCFPPPPGSVHPLAENPVPVVMVVFDGFAGMTLLDERHELDHVRYPNFARLARISRWYPNATTVHCRTGSAVPGLLSGRLPAGEAPAVESEYPVNLFSMIHNTGQYEMTVFEPLTRLCPSELFHQPVERTRPERIARAMQVLSAVYVHTTIHPVSDWRPQIPDAWFGFPDEGKFNRTPKTGWIATDWEKDRPEQLDHFLQCLEPVSQPSFRFLHVVLPHDPLRYFADGRQYFTSDSLVQPMLGAHGLGGEEWGPDELAARAAWRRYLLQAQLVDRFIGNLLDRLESDGTLDDTLLIVTADHGMAFRAGDSRREPGQHNLGALLPVPLFVKLPGESTGERIEDNVETIDVLPTIADALELDIPGPVNGASLLDARERPRPRKTVVLTSGMQIAVDPDFPEKYEVVADMVRAFGSGTGEDRLWEADIHPEWLGRPVADFNIGPRSSTELQLECGLTFLDPDPHAPAPGFFQGIATGVEAEKGTTIIVVAVNGVVAGVTRTLADPDYPGGWNVLIPYERFQPGSNAVKLFEATPSGDIWELRECSVTGLESSHNGARLNPVEVSGVNDDRGS